jgi:predicted transcriptional regulator
MNMKLDERTLARADDQSVTVRFPPGLIPRLDEAAGRNGRSRNSEIVQRLTDSLDQEKRKKTK